jgi:acyl carrier protein
MTDTEVIELVNRSLVEEFEVNPSVLTPDAHLVEDLGFDSLDFIDVAVVLQQSFGVTLRDEPRVREIRTLGDLYHLVIEKKRELEGGKAPG